MSSMEVKSFNTPDDTRPLADMGAAELVTLAGANTVLKASFEPGWHWADHVRSIAGTESCRSPHLLFCLSGRMHLRMDDGTEGEFGPNDVARVEPGHDAWVVGDEPCVIVDFGASPAYPRPAQPAAATRA
jgi:hypothetical protein